MSLGAGAALAAIHHPARDQLLLLRHAFRPDHPHRELCRELRHPADRRGHDLQRRGAGRHGRPHRLRPARRPFRRQARAGARACSRRRSARSPMSSCASSPRSTRSAALFGFIYAGIMPLYAVLMRENFPLRMMGTVIGGTAMAGSLGMATGPLAGGLIYDAFCQLRLALYRLLGDGPRRLPDGDDVQAVSQKGLQGSNAACTWKTPQSLTEKQPAFSGSFQSRRNVSLFRHGRACPGHPRLSCGFVVKTWMPGIADKFTQSAQGRLLWPGMTSFAVRPNFIGCLSVSPQATYLLIASALTGV